jgi:hypothetical protein
MLKTLTIGGGRVDLAGNGARLSLPPTSSRVYADAQLDDYHREAPSAGRLRRSRFPDRPPLRVSLRARASHAFPAGTFGFGLWNDPFSLAGGVLAAPNCIWFFYASPPSDMALADGVPGQGWKVATLNSGRIPGLVLAPAALIAVALTRVPGLGRPVMSTARRAVHAHESSLEEGLLTDWHHYALEWHSHQAVFHVDGVERLRSPAPPPGPLGFVLWMDNQYAIASRQGRFGFGLCEVKEEQWLEVEDLRIES